MFRIVLKYAVLFVVMTVPASMLLNLLDVAGMLETFFALSVYIGFPLFLCFLAELASWFLGIPFRGGGSSFADDAYLQPDYGVTYNPTTASMMLNKSVDIEGRLYGQGPE
jgi:hypothetical protein